MIFEIPLVWTSRSEVLSELFKSKKLSVAISSTVNSGRSAKTELREELRSELFLRLCELPEEDLKEIFDDGYLEFYILRTIKNMFDSKTSQFFTKIKKHVLDRHYGDSIETLMYVGEESDPMAEAVVEAMKKLTWFEAEILDRYSQCNSLRDVAKETGVSLEYATKMLGRARKKLKHVLSS